MWNGYLISVYLQGDYALAHQILDSIFQMVQNPDQKEEDKQAKPYMICELHLFRALLHEKSGDLRKAIKYVEKKSKVIIDEVRRCETLVRMYLLDNKTNKALEAVNRLIELN